jgi:hypothetical protein
VHLFLVAGFEDQPADENPDAGGDQDCGDGMIDNDIFYRFDRFMVICLYLLSSGTYFDFELVYP